MIQLFKKLGCNYKKILPVILMVAVLSVAVFGPLAVSQTYAAEDPLTSSGNWLTKSLTGAMNGILAFLGLQVMAVTIAALTISGYILDLSIQFSLNNFAALAKDTGMVGVGWGVLRDLSNLVFIFLILWVAISTILGLHHGSAMGSVLRIVIAAVLINFSLFITKAVIDVANIIALHFYSLTVVPSNGSPGSLAGVFMQALNPQSIYPPGNESFASFTETRIIFAAVLGSIAMIVAAWVFIATAVMFIIRTIYLILLMILSPFAFIAWVVPGMSGQTHNWWKRLFHQAFFAPIILVMFYIIGYAIQHGALSVSGTLNDVVKSFDASGAANQSLTPGVFSVLVNYLILLGMIIASLVVANTLGAAGATTMINWGNAIRKTGQSWVAGRTIGMGARNLDERLGKSWIGNTAAGKKLREWTTIPLKDTKWGGKMSAEERHKEDLELESKRREAMEIGKVPFGVATASKVVGAIPGAKKLGFETVGDTSHNAEAILKRIEQVKQAGENKVAASKMKTEEARRAVQENTDATKTTALVTAFKEAEADQKEVEQEFSDELREEREKLQDVLVRIDPHSFAEMVPKDLLFTKEFMRNASRAQLMAVLGSDHFAEVEKDKVRAARYGHIEDARKKVAEANKNYAQDLKDYLEFFTVPGGIKAKIGKQLDRLGLLQGTPERAKMQSDLMAAIDAYNHASPTEKELALEEGLKLLKKPEKKMIGDVDSAARIWIRAMNEHELDEWYKYNPELVGDRDVTPTIRSRAIIYARQSEKISSKDSDRFRDSKLCPIIDANDLKDAIGEIAPSFDTFRHMVDSLVANGGRQAEVLKRMDVYNDPNAYKRLEGGSKEAWENWEKIKEDYLRKAIKTVAYEKGNLQKYLDSLKDEQKAMRALGTEKMLDAVGGQSNDEFALLRGLRWRDPAFAESVDRAMAREFRGKDTSDIKELMDMVLYRFRDYLKDNANMISRSNMDLLHWITTESSGKEFVKREQINPELAKTFDDMQKIFSAVGRNPTTGLNTELLQKVVSELKRSKEI